MTTEQLGQPIVRSGWTRPIRVLTMCALSALALLLVRSANWFNLATVSPGISPDETQLSAYVALAATIGALVVWHLFPARSWPWLLLGGAAVAAVDALLRVAPELYQDWMEDVYYILVSCAPALTMIGFLGAATRIWHAGQKAFAAAMTGSAIVIQLVGPVVFRSLVMDSPEVYRWTTFCLVLLAFAGAIIAVVVASAARVPAVQQRPAWRVTLLAGLGSAAPLVILYWQPAETEEAAAVGDYLLYLGLTFYAIGLVAGALSGMRALAAGLATGLIIGGFGMLIQPAAVVLYDLPTLAVILSLGAVIAGFAGAMTRARLRIAIGGLGLVSLGLLVMFLLFISDSPLASYDTFTRVLTPILLVIGVIAGTSAIGSIGEVLAEHAEAPAVLAGISVPFSLGTVGILGFIAANPPEGKAPLASMLPSVLVALVLAAALVNLLANRRRATREPLEPVDVTGSSVPPTTR